MRNAVSQKFTSLLGDWEKGNKLALEQLLPLVYDELRRMAKNHMRRHSPGHTLQTTELIHETYLKIAKYENQDWQSRAHFFAVAAQAMRYILVDHARSKKSQKRGGMTERITLEESIFVPQNRSEEILALDDALKLLAALDERKASVVEMKFFGGLNIEEIAVVLKISPETVKRDWKFARTWLLRELTNEK